MIASFLKQGFLIVKGRDRNRTYQSKGKGQRRRERKTLRTVRILRDKTLCRSSRQPETRCQHADMVRSWQSNNHRERQGGSTTVLAAHLSALQ